ncbi:hypothetical protein Pfo_004087 [Paulownia fortunei]|nr:hypothetical protein Pfo_004087 [Paulownia fortunei]
MEMSLHIGNLSSHIRRDDLERVFRRFGRCTIQVKDKYGFVVYDYPASAEKALKTLRGTRICGEAITLSWSNRQPRALQRFATGGKSYEPPCRKYSVKENADRRLGSNDRRDYEMDSKKADGEVRKLGSSDFVDESISYHLDVSKRYVGERDHTSPNDHHGIGDAEKNHLEDDRWGEQVVDPSNENYSENGLEFDRYEPYHSDGKKELDEHQHISPLVGSPSIRKSKDRTGNTYNRKSQKNCYICGEVGHKMSKCPLELKRHMSRFRGRLHPSGDTVPLRSQESDREPSTSRNRWRLLGREGSPPLQITTRGRRKEFRDKKRNRIDFESQDKNHLDRARGPSSSSIHSVYTSSRSQSPSRSLRSLSRPRSLSKSKSVPSKKISLSSLRSSPSRCSGSKTFKSQSTSRSMSPTSSLLPVELNRNVSPSPNKRQKDSKGSVENAVGLAHSTDLFEEETLVRSGTGASKSENITSAVENECETRPAKLELEDMKKDVSEKDIEHCHSVSKGSRELLESYIPQSDGDDHIVDKLFLHSVKEMRDSQNEDIVGEHILAPESDISFRSNASNSARMSSEEMYMVLKHYGLQYPEESEKDLPVEIYFGSARSWPWELIYYRRLKKGPISAENYSRRIAQNEEFGIVDKYIRGSSGWGELNENNP